MVVSSLDHRRQVNLTEIALGPYGLYSQGKVTFSQGRPAPLALNLPGDKNKGMSNHGGLLVY
ncbi:MAG: hypothetical protein V1758_01765 [Pseudomonadota bacterium]